MTRTHSTSPDRQDLAATMRVLRPAPHLFGFYDGRIAGRRLWSAEPNWLDDGAFELGSCTYAVVDGGEALVYDTHMSIDHARAMRRVLEAEGFGRIRVVLSHWHADHVAGNAVFGDCEILANALTSKILAEKRQDLAAGNPPIDPLVMPTRTFERELDLAVGAVPVRLRTFDIHSRDGTVLFLPEAGLLLCGDTLEDPITYVSEPDRLADHRRDLDRLAIDEFTRILPNHGAEATIAAGGYGRDLLDATRRYVDWLLALDPATDLAGSDLKSVLAADLASGAVGYHAPYEAVHRQNVERVLGARA